MLSSLLVSHGNVLAPLPPGSLYATVLLEITKGWQLFHLRPVSAQPGTCYAQSFLKPQTVSCCQVTNCLLLVSKSVGSRMQEGNCWGFFGVSLFVFLKKNKVINWFLSWKSRTDCDGTLLKPQLLCSIFIILYTYNLHENWLEHNSVSKVCSSLLHMCSSDETFWWQKWKERQQRERDGLRGKLTGIPLQIPPVNDDDNIIV